MVGGTFPKNPLNPEEYVIYEERGFEWAWIGMFKTLRPIRKAVGFLADEFKADCNKLGLGPYMGEDGQIYSTFLMNF